MKRLVLVIALISILFTEKSFAQDNSSAKNSEYCILSIYGQGWVGRSKGIFIVREDLKVEVKSFKDDSNIGILRETMENITLLKNEGYTLVSTSIVASPANISEYVFKKQK
jgi:hypothetical protein